MGGDGNVVVSSRSGDRLGGRQVISSRMDFRFGVWYMGTNFLRKFLFLSVSFRFLSLVLVMLSRDLSPNILRSGLWSTAIVRFLHPRTKCLALSRASATASASPSIGAYLDSAA